MRATRRVTRTERARLRPSRAARCAREARVRARSGCVATLLAALAGVGVPLAPVAAQQRDTVRAADTSRVALPSVRAPNRGPPISPRRAFLQSLVVPGWGQSSLDRGTAGALFVAVELGSLAMAIKSKHDLDLAKRFRNDSIIVGYTQSNGVTVPVFARRPIGVLVEARRQHFEDYVALLVFNHLIAGADAYVAAHLWEVPGRVSVRRLPGGVAVGARFIW